MAVVFEALGSGLVVEPFLGALVVGRALGLAGSAAQKEHIASIIAWMLWHLAGQEEQWKKEFLEPTGQFQMGIYKSEIKNW